MLTFPDIKYFSNRLVKLRKKVERKLLASMGKSGQEYIDVKDADVDREFKAMRQEAGVYGPTLGDTAIEITHDYVFNRGLCGYGGKNKPIFQKMLNEFGRKIPDMNTSNFEIIERIQVKSLHQSLYFVTF